MTIGFRASTNPSATGGTADPVAAIALPTGTASGDMVVLALWFKYSTETIVSTPSGWTAPANNETTGGAGAAGIDTGVGRIALFFREYDGVWSMPTIDLSAAPNVSMLGAVSYSKGAGEAWEPVVCANTSDTTGSTTSYDPPASGTTIDFAAGDWFGHFTGINGDAGTQTSVTQTVAGVTFGANNVRWNVGTTTGQDARSQLSDRTYTSGTASAGPDISIAYTSANASMAGATVFYRLRVVAAIDLVIDNLSQAQTLETFAFTQDHTLVIDNLSQGETLEAFAFTQVHQLVIAALTQAQTLDNLTVDSSTNLVIADLTQAQTLDNLALTQVHQLIVNALTQAQTLDNLTLTQVHQLVIAALTQAQTLDNLTLTQIHQLVITALTQAQTLDNLTITTGAIDLIIASLTQAQTLDNLALTQVHELVIASLTQAQTLDSLTLTQVHQLTIAALTQAQTLSTLALTVAGALRPTIDVVAVALIRALTGIPATRVDTTLPKDTIIWAAGFIQAVGISEQSGMYVPLHVSSINVSCWATNIGSGKPPWGKANQLAEALKVECLDHNNFPITLNLTPFGAYAPARVHSAYFVNEPHRILSDEGSYARYNGDLIIHWVPL